MWAALLPIIGQIIGMVREQKGAIADKAGVSTEAVEKVTTAIENYISKDERVLQMAEQAINNARQHDTSTYNPQDKLVNTARGLVRPVCSFIAIVWYVAARACGVELLAEDYAIIGGILAFWFGFRPFEKRQK